MLALLAFPFLLEPRFAVRTQSVIWAVGYAGLVVFIIACAILLNRSRAATTEVSVGEEAVEPVGTTKRLEWILLAFVPSSLMLGVTTYIATDVASVPLIWIVPLALYLLTFIIAFARIQIIPPWIVSLLLPFVLVTRRRLQNHQSTGFRLAHDPAASDFLLHRRARLSSTSGAEPAARQ